MNLCMDNQSHHKSFPAEMQKIKYQFSSFRVHDCDLYLPGLTGITSHVTSIFKVVYIRQFLYIAQQSEVYLSKL